MRAAVINLSHPHYNLGAAKLATWLRSRGDEAVEFDSDPGMFLVDFDLVCVSAIFSWDVRKGVDAALRGRGYDVWAGGPGFMYLADWWKAQTGFDAHWGLDWRFERQRGNYRMCFAARGCPVGCHFCGVTKWEGKEYTPDFDFQPEPILCDNNITDEPVEFQEHIIRRYQERGVKLLDANSGFEPKNFTDETYQRWKPILRGPWRFGYDYLPERGAAKRMLEILKGESPKKKRVYVMIGNEPFGACLQRATEVIEWGGEPYCQPFLEKTALDRSDYVVKYDWTHDKLTHFARYFNRFLWKYTPMEEYRCGRKQPFAVVN
ncbi:MAG: hypothetical protein M3N41_05995 [Acidobacteriota bacterium]|nr:hypothetical protein [Acidobacteriota bacterium]